MLLPYGRSGILGAIVLGMGRALGETIAVTMVIGNNLDLSPSILHPGYTMASIIANEFTEATFLLYTSSLIQIGLVLSIHPDNQHWRTAPRMARSRSWRSNPLSTASPFSQGAEADHRRRITNRLMLGLATAAAVIAIAPLIWILVCVTLQAAASLSIEFLLRSRRRGHPREEVLPTRLLDPS